MRARAAALVLAAMRDDVRTSGRWHRAGSRAEQAEACAERTPPYVRAQMPTQRRTAMWISRRARTGHRQTAVVIVVGDGRTGAVGMRAVGTGRSIVPQCARADADAVADGDRGGVAALTSVVIHAAENGGSQALRQRVGDECLRRLMSMLPCAMDSSTAPSAALVAATEMASAVSAAIVKWSTRARCPRHQLRLPRAGRKSTCVGHAVTRTGEKACDRGARVTQEPRIVLGGFASGSGTKVGVVSDGELDGDDDALVMVETVQVEAERAASVVVVDDDRRGSATTAIRSPLLPLPGGANVASDRSRAQVARDNRRAAAGLRCGRMAVIAWSCRKRR